MTKLSVNVNKVATLRNTRDNALPSLVHAAELCIKAGADGITVHPRPDQRHIRPQDVADLYALLQKHPTIEFNIEGNPFMDYMPFIERYRPTQCTFVPDAREAMTSNQGWKLREKGVIERLEPIVRKCRSLGCRVSLFMDAGTNDLDLVKKLGADRIELYTEPYAVQFAAGSSIAADAFAATSKQATKLGLGVNAGHDLNLHNLAPLLSACPEIAEVSIGHALIADALEFGLPTTVKKYLAACGRP